MEIVTFATALLAGVVSIMSPCVLPLLPGVMAYSTEKNKLTPLAIVLGLSLSFTAMGIASAIFGSLLFDYMDYIKAVSGIFIIVMGLYLLFESVENIILRLWQYVPVSRVHLSSAEEGGFLGGLLLGASLGIVWIPCIGPILASILMIVAQQGGALYGASLLMVYSMGLAIPMLIIAYSSNIISDRMRSLCRHTMAIRKIAGLILVLAGLYFVAGLGLLSSII